MRRRNASRSSGFARAASYARAARCSAVPAVETGSLAAVWERTSTGRTRKSAAPIGAISGTRRRFVLGMFLVLSQWIVTEARAEDSLRARPNVRRYREPL